jgi:ABC-type glycerol-3-phosphate transport system substrate-binding protein/beta-lactamase regulating signal transducer with metallopeptidase domain
MNLPTLFNSSSAEPIFQFLVMMSLKTTVLLLIVQLVLFILRGSSAALRHWLLTLGLAGVLLLPLLSIYSPGWSLPILPEARVSGYKLPLKFPEQTARPEKSPVVSNKPIKPTNSLVNASNAYIKKAIAQVESTTPKIAVNPAPGLRLSVSTVLLMIWLVGMTWVLTRWIRQWLSIWQITRRGCPADANWINVLDTQARFLNIKRTVRLIVSDEITIPMTWGMWQPVILLPRDAPDWYLARRQVVLLHELAHITRGDYLTQWLVLVGCAINWFNPLVWKTARQSVLEREQASDDLVLNAGVQGTDYAVHLLEIARNAIYGRSFQMIGLAMTGHSDLERRIRGILNTRKNRSILQRTRGIVMLGLVGLLLLLGGMKLSHADAQEVSTILTVAADPGVQDVARSTGILDDFESQHPDVTIQFVDISRVPDAADDLDAHFQAIQDYANSADVLFFDGYNLSLTPHDTRAGYVLDLAPLINSDSTFQADDFYPQIWSSFQWDNGIWGVPTGADMVVLNYDKTAFDRAGLTYPTGDWSWDNFVSMATLLTQRDANGYVTVAGFGNSGRIFREALWRSQFMADLVDSSNLSNTPQFTRADIESVVDTYHQLEDQGIIGNNPVMYVDVARKQPRDNFGWSLLPGNKTVLLPYGFAVSGGTQHPELAYELVKYLSEKPDLIDGIPARQSLVTNENQVVIPEYQALIDHGFQNALTYSNLRFTDYLNGAWNFVGNNGAATQEALQAAEEGAINDLSTAESKKGTLALMVVEPTPVVLAPGEIALNFNVASFAGPLPAQDQWDRVIQDFVASDPQVGAVNLETVPESVDNAAANYDCFYLPTNAVPTLPDNAVLPLDPLLSTDPNFDPDDFFGSTLAAVQRDTLTYALPIDIQPFVLRYASERFTEASLPEPTNTWTVEQFADALVALQPSSQGQAPFADSGSGGTYLLVLMAGYGGLPLDYRTMPVKINFTDPATLTAIQQVLDLARNGYLHYEALGNLDGGGFGGPNETTAIYPASLNGLARKIPPGTMPDKPVLFPSGHQYNGLAYDLGTTYISAQSQNPEACYRFISTIAQHPELFSNMPVRRSQLNNPTFQAATNPDVLALYTQVETLLGDANTIPFPTFTKAVGANVSDFLFQYWLFQAFDTYVLEDADLEAALADAQTMAQAYQTCAANLPPVDLGGMTESDTNPIIPYVDCAKAADPSLEPILDP